MFCHVLSACPSGLGRAPVPVPASKGRQSQDMSVRGEASLRLGETGMVPTGMDEPHTCAFLPPGQGEGSPWDQRQALTAP